jgi:hypothetical protein
MLRKLDSPESVLAFEAVGRIERSDYETVLEPAVHAMVADRGEVRLVYVLGEAFDGYSFGAGWEDTKIGLSIFSKWKRCAVATDHDWIRHAISMLGWMMPGEIKVFDPSEVETAMEWAAA